MALLSEAEKKEHKNKIITKQKRKPPNVLKKLSLSVLFATTTRKNLRPTGELVVSAYDRELGGTLWGEAGETVTKTRLAKHVFTF